ncbi:MAG: UDP-N-acetylmuramate dehydrogenase [Candidatus Gastranaerophilales bacterium]|nr:UDP-N-acetylmuramate dehydrogenase [Candidatus Gastranaerophilales bacterium]
MIKTYENYSIKNQTTFKIGGSIKKAAFPDSIKDLVTLLKSKEYDMVLGGCSNVLFSSGQIDKKIIFTNNIKDFSVEGNKVHVSCGTRGALVSKSCMDNCLTGFEFMIGFPGTFGGMIYMNASAHNQSISDYFKSASVYDTDTDEVIVLQKNDMDFGYRKSVIQKKNYIVLEAEFELISGEKSKIEEIMHRNIEFRKTRQPSLTYGNAGSIFKNPENDSAGRLLDLCEMKGQTEGGAKVFENHANFIINYNNAESLDVLTLMYKMYSKVREKYTIELKPEIKYIGNKGTQEYRLWEIMTEENIQMIQK